MLLLQQRNREFRPYWFETGSPIFLFRMLMEKSIGPMELENRLADMSLVSKFDVGDIGIEALLFQTGYLTIAEEQRDEFDNLYRLDYPNLEVRISLNRGFLQHLGKPVVEATGQGRVLCALLEAPADDFAGFGDRLRSYLSGIPYQWQLHRCHRNRHHLRACRPRPLRAAGAQPMQAAILPATRLGGNSG